jgi:hypothetical protein
MGLQVLREKQTGKASAVGRKGKDGGCPVEMTLLHHKTRKGRGTGRQGNERTVRTAQSSVRRA